MLLDLEFSANTNLSQVFWESIMRKHTFSTKLNVTKNYSTAGMATPMNSDKNKSNKNWAIGEN